MTHPLDPHSLQLLHDHRRERLARAARSRTGAGRRTRQALRPWVVVWPQRRRPDPGEALAG